jgi:Transglutaminase-like superfamily
MKRVVTHRIRRLATLDLGELAELARAQFELLAAQFLVSTRPTGRLISPENVAHTIDGVPIDPWAARIATTIRRAADHGIFRPHCLVRAVATKRMLDRQGFRGSQIRIGVHSNDRGVIAHAWVEYGGRVIGDTLENVGRYAAFDGVRLIDRE